MDTGNKLRKKVAQQVQRMERAEREHSSLLAQTIYLGTLGLLFVLPVIAGAYLGNWLDRRDTEYHSHWTVCFILIGVVVGIINVYFYLREHE